MNRSLRLLRAVYFLLLFLVFLAGLGFLLWSLYKQSTVGSWIETRGVIEVLRIDEHRTLQQGTSYLYYSPYILYSYEVDGTEYFNNRLSFTNDNQKNSYSAVKKALEEKGYFQGAVVLVYYNPEDPADSLLETQFQLSGNMIALIIFFLPFLGYLTLLPSGQSICKSVRSSRKMFLPVRKDEEK